MALPGRASHERSCAGCTRPLSRYNPGDYCGPCSARSERATSTARADLGARLRSLRLRRGMSLEVLAGLSGKSSAYLSMIENGKRSLDRYSLIVALADALGVPPAELATGSPAEAASGLEPPQWCTDPLTDLADIGRTDLTEGPGRRRVLTGAAYSAAAAALPETAWWQPQADRPHEQQAGNGRVGPDDVGAVQQLAAAFSRIDQRLGGGHGRRSLAQYLHGDAAALLTGNFTTDRVRRDMFTAVGELAYLSGWMAFDNGEHPLAQRYFQLSLKLAARAGNPPLAGHIMRAMAHQAMDLNYPALGLELSAASME